MSSIVMRQPFLYKRLNRTGEQFPRTHPDTPPFIRPFNGNTHTKTTPDVSSIASLPPPFMLLETSEIPRQRETHLYPEIWI